MDRRTSPSIRPQRQQGRALAVLVATRLAWSSMAAQAAPPSDAARPADGAPPSDAAPRSSSDEHEALRVTVDPGIEDAVRIPGWIAERNAETLSRLGDPPGHERWVEVRVGGETYAYRIEVTAMRDGKPLGPRPEPVMCECTSEELLERIDGEVLRAVGELEQPAVEESESGGTETGPGEPEVPPDGEVPSEPPPSWWRPTGAALTAVGGAGLVAGVVMTAVGERPVRAEGIQIAQSRDWRRPSGYVVLGVGAGVLAGGVALLVLHRRSCVQVPGSCGGKERTSRRGPGRQDWAVVPWIGGDELGVGLLGRFSGRRG